MRKSCSRLPVLSWPACTAATDPAPHAASYAKSGAGKLGRRSRRNGQERQARRQLLRLRQRQLVQVVGNPGRPFEHRLVPESPDPEREAHAGDRRRLEARPYDQLAPEERKLRDLYDAFVDQKQIDGRGLEPVKADLA